MSIAGVTFGLADLALVLVVTFLAFGTAYFPSPRAKSICFSIPLPFSAALISSGQSVDAPNAIRFLALWAFVWIAHDLIPTNSIIMHIQRCPVHSHEEKAIEISYSQPNRAERLIAAGRIFLATFALFAIWLDPTEPAEYIVAAYLLLAGYLCYSIVLYWAAWRTDLARTHSAVVIHALDLLIFAVFMFLTTAPTSPFFAFFVFSVVSATLSWQWRGIIYSAAVGLGVQIAMALYLTDLPRGHEFEINHVIFRIGYLLVVATLLGYLGVYEQQQRDRMAGLAAWPSAGPEEINLLVSEILQRSSSLLGASRTLLLWKVEEEPLLHTASWSSGQFRHSLESPQTFGALVAEPLEEEDFLCRDSLAPKPLVLRSSPTGFERWQGMPLHPEGLPPYFKEPIWANGPDAGRADHLILLAIYCHDEHQEHVSVKRLREICIKIRNEMSLADIVNDTGVP